MNYLKIRDAVIEVMLNEIDNTSTEYQTNLLEYTHKILMNLEKKLNVSLKTDNTSMLHTGEIPNCCINCDNYKEGQVSICNCTLPCIDLLKGYIGDTLNEI